MLFRSADQVDGYAPKPGPDLPESERLAAAEAFIAALGIDTVYGSASAYYHIAEDRIHMPDFSAFHDAHGFYATRIHEAAHASGAAHRLDRRSEEHTSELQSIIRISYAVFSLKKKNNHIIS